MYSYIKRFVDIVVSFLALVLLWPVFVMVVLLSKFLLGSPVFFKQKRPGKNEKIFSVYKFRTMTNETDLDGNLLPDNERLKGFGAFLRKTSLDELPQLLNVLKGEMSLIGPRPFLISYLPLYSAEQRRRHEVTPGITGWAQVNGRNAISWTQKLKYDVYYVENQSFLLDLKILVLTLYKLVRCDNINQNDSTTMDVFNGHN